MLRQFCTLKHRPRKKLLDARDGSGNGSGTASDSASLLRGVPFMEYGSAKPTVSAKNALVACRGCDGMTAGRESLACCHMAPLVVPSRHHHSVVKELSPAIKQVSPTLSASPMACMQA